MFFRKRLKKWTPEDDEKLARAMNENNVGFKDRIAMVIAAFIVIVIPCLLVLLGISGLALLLFGGFN